MEAWESSDQIRPLPPEAPSSSSPRGPGESPRRWIPLAIAGIALGAFAVGSTLFTRSEPGDIAAPTTTTTTTTTVPPLASADTATTTTTTTLPPTLETRVPGIDRVRVVVVNGSRTVEELWESLMRAPAGVEVGEPMLRAAAYDAGGDLLALLTGDVAGIGTLRVGNGLYPTRFVDVSSMAWHDTQSGRIAFVARLPFEDEATLLTASVDPVTFELLDLERVITADPGGSIVAWGDWGFAVNTTTPLVILVDGTDGTPAEIEAPAVAILDPDGNETARTEGWVVDTLPEGVMLIRTFWDIIEVTDGVAIITERHEVTRSDPSLIPNGRYDLLTPDSVAYLNPDGSTMSEVTVNPSGVTLVTSRNFDRPSNRSGSVPGFLEPLGFTEDGRLFILHDAREAQLVFVDWSNSTQYRVPTTSGTAIAVDAR